MPIGSTSVLYDGAVIDVMEFTATRAADVTFAWFATASITNGMFSWAIAKKMPWLTVIMLAANRGRRNTRPDIVTNLAYIILGRMCALRAVIDKVLGVSGS